MISRRHTVSLLTMGALLATVSAAAGSFEDFFENIRRDDGRDLQKLVSRGFDPNTRDPQGATGLILALQLGSMNAAAALINSPRTDVNLRNPDSETALMLAALRGHVEAAQALIALGADINHPGWTPLHYAASGTTERQTEIIALLLDNAAYLDATSPNGTTPLMMAARYGSGDAVNLLLKEGADISLRNQLGLSAIDFAQRAERKSVAEDIANAIRRRQPQRGRW